MRDLSMIFLKTYMLLYIASIANDPFGNLEPNSIYKPILDYSTKLAIDTKKIIFCLFGHQAVLFMVFLIM